MQRSVAYLLALSAAMSCVLPSVEVDPSLGLGGDAGKDGSTGNVSNAGSNSSSGGKNGSSSAGSNTEQGGTGAEGGDDSVGGRGGSITGGSSANGGQGGVAGSDGGTAGLSGASGGGGGPTKNPPTRSAGCDSVTTVTSGEKFIEIDGQQRSYSIDIPADYDMTKPYRLFYASHWISSNDEAVVNEGFYYLKPRAIAAGEPAIFVAPQALPGNPNGTWSANQDVDHLLFENILAFVQQNLCIDETRVFAIGFSYGGMLTYSLTRNQQSRLRAAVGIAPTNYNIYLPPAVNEPIPWMQTTGLSDNTSKWINSEANMTGAKFVALERATENGCDIPADLPIWQQGSYFCYDFEGCDAGYPTKVCTFDAGHVSAGSTGSSTNWIGEEAWNFFTQF